MADIKNRRQKQLRVVALSRRKKTCPIGSDGPNLNYKDVEYLKDYITDCGKIIPRRISGVSASNQRKLTKEIKRARNIALLSFTEGYVNPES